MTVDVRAATAADRPAVWALNAIPNIGETGDDSWPIAEALGYERIGTETRPGWTWTLVYLRRGIG